MSPRIGLDLSKIVKIAIEIADQEGVQAVTMATLANRLNVRPPSLYNHINGLPELRKELAIYGLEQLYDTMITAVAMKEKDEAIKALAISYVSFARNHPGLYEATLLAPDNEDSDVQLAGNKIVELVLNSLAHYRLNNDDALHTVRGLRSILHGFSLLEQMGGFGIPLNLDQSLDFIINTYLSGVVKIKR